jgi:uncharacterized protein (TIGR00251 family)
MDDPSLQIRETAAGLEVRIHVQPRARRNELAGIHNGALKLKVLAPPVDDAANRAIIEFFSSLLDISKSSIRIISGQKSRDKTLLIQGLSQKAFIALANIS